MDFVLEQDEKIIPIEVKSGKDYQRHVALSNILANSEYKIQEAIVLSNNNLSTKNNIIYAPVYMTMFMHHHKSEGQLLYKVDLTGI